MGLGPPILALYRQLKLLGALDGIDSVVELGSQGVWCPDRRLLTGLFEAFERPIPPSQELDVYIDATGTGHAASSLLLVTSMISTSNIIAGAGRLPGEQRRQRHRNQRPDED
jgi:hypothetical protein